MASSSSTAEAPEAVEISLDDDFDLEEFKSDPAVQEVLTKGTDLRKYASEVEAALRSVERESIQDYIGESESLAGLHTQIRQCDGVLDSMESMLRGFQTDLAAISTQIKYLQDESLSMNVKLRNRKAAESQLSGFIQQIVVPPDLITAICESEVNEAYLAYVVELNKKVSFAKQESTAMTSASSVVWVTRPPGVRRILASPSLRPSISRGSIRESMHVTMPTPALAMPSNPPSEKDSA